MDAAATRASDNGKRKRRQRHKRRRGSDAVQAPGDRDAHTAAGGLPVELSDAERALKWQGPKIALPKRALDFADDSHSSAAQEERRALESGEINAVLRGQSQEILRCIADARGSARLRGPVTLKMRVNERGRVDRIRVRAPVYLLERGLYDCVAPAGRQLAFPATGAATIVDAPYHLE